MKPLLGYSPLSVCAIELYFGLTAQGLLTIWVLVPRRVLSETRDDRETFRLEEYWKSVRKAKGEPYPPYGGPNPDDPELDCWLVRRNALPKATDFVWPQNRDCLFNVIAEMRDAAPFKFMDIDSKILNLPGKFESIQ
jgi:hypothetical protein